VVVFPGGIFVFSRSALVCYLALTVGGASREKLIMSNSSESIPMTSVEKAI
jgi:hypothetical protein